MFDSTCIICSKVSGHLCAGCNIVSYCSSKCQKIDWVHMNHKMICNDLKRKRFDADLSYDFGLDTKSARTLSQTATRQHLPQRLLALLDNQQWIYNWVQSLEKDRIVQYLSNASDGFYKAMNENNYVWYFIYHRFIQKQELPRNNLSIYYDSAINYKSLVFDQGVIWTTNIERETVLNANPKQVIFRNQLMEIAVEAIPMNGIVGPETHYRSSQFIKVEEGTALITIDNQNYLLSTENNNTIVVPPNTEHTIRALTDFKFHTIYSPPL